MKTQILILALIVLFSCKKDERNNLVNSGTIDSDSVSTNKCTDANYTNWETSNYVLPYPVNSSYTIGLSQCTSSYHGAGKPDQFAIDFNMPIGSAIQCSRSGIVIYVEESGLDYQFPNNLIVIDHGDGTYGEYMHLTKDGASVSVGQSVVQGTDIGLSGATGLAGYPHLHFVIAINDWQYPYESIPFNYKNTTPNPTSLVQGETYTALLY
jgi:murein DD-endopeptidase MepM/ murein hydrolase activator NlpD